MNQITCNGNKVMIQVEKCIFVNRAPFEKDLEITFREGVSVLCGVNGRGKTTILSYIVDALYEIARPNYKGSFEGIENKYYRISSDLYSFDSSMPSIVYIRFIIDNDCIDYIDVRGKLSSDEYNSKITLDNKIVFDKISNELSNSNNAKLFSCRTDDGRIKNLFSRNVITFFPSYRYELPSYLGEAYKFNRELTNDASFAGTLPNPIEVRTGVNDFKNWVLDLVLDWLVNKDKNILQIPTEQGIIEKDGTPERLLYSIISTMMRKVLSSKKYPGNIRFGIGRRCNGANRVFIWRENPAGRDELICPDLSLLSSGETALMCLFGEIIRQADKIRNNIPLADIHGLVIIDEIDKHLHIRLQKEVLPSLMTLFPNVQFIVTSHSPFINMGLALNSGIKSQIYDLDNGAIPCAPTTNDIYQSTYEMFLNERNHYADEVNAIKEKLRNINKPIVITEGKTDWKHIKKALCYFQSKGQFIELDFNLQEYDHDFGDSQLDSTLKHFSQWRNDHKIVGVFDCDEANGKEIHKLGGVKEYGNNVYGMSIPVPKEREYNTNGISIEFLYNDEDLMKTDCDGRRIFLTSEFSTSGRLTSHKTIGVQNVDKIKRYVNKETEKIVDNDVVDENERSLALSKDSFARRILYSEDPFDVMDFSGFMAVFERLSQILNK